MTNHGLHPDVIRRLRSHLVRPKDEQPKRKRRPSAEWDAAPVVSLPRVLCPHCGAEGHKPHKTLANGDGTATLKCVCRTCGGLFKIVRESTPDYGLFVSWPDTLQT